MPDPEWEKWLLSLCLWREARNQKHDAIVAAACSIRNRVNSPRWWGHDWVSVILCPEQYSSFNRNDVNSTKFPASADPVFPQCRAIAAAVHDGTQPDTVSGAQSYYDRSLDANPPAWRDTMTWVCDVDSFHFYRV